MVRTVPPTQARTGPLKVAWISYFPVEWLDNVPDEVKRLPRQHPATWQQALLAELEHRTEIKLHIVVVRSTFERDLTFDRNGVTFHLLKTRPGWRAASLFWVDTLRIRRVLNGVRPDVVHAWGSENGAALVALRLGYPHVVSVQGLLSWYRTLVPINRYEKLAAHLERYSLRRVQLITAESTDTQARLQSAYPGRPTVHIEHPPLQHFASLTRQPDQSPIRLLSVGAMGYRKGSDLYLSALGRLVGETDFRCVALGRPDTAYLESARSGLPDELWRRFEFRHATTNDAVAEEYQSATLMIMPTRADTGPVAVKEAVSAGVPVVATEIGGVPDYVVPGRNGLISRPGDLDDLTARIREAFAHPLFSRGQVEADTLAAKRQHLDAGRAAEQFVEAYHRVHSERRR